MINSIEFVPCFLFFSIRQAHGLHLIRLKSTTQKWFHATLTWIFAEMPYEFPPLRQGISSHIGFVFYLRCCVCASFCFLCRFSSPRFAFTNPLAIASQIVIHTRARRFDFGNFIFCVGRRMREFQPKDSREQRIKNAVLYFSFLWCVCARVISVSDVSARKDSPIEFQLITCKRDMRTPLTLARTHAPNSNTIPSLGNSMRNQPYAKIIYKCDLLIEFSLKKKRKKKKYISTTFHPYTLYLSNQCEWGAHSSRSLSLSLEPI